MSKLERLASFLACTPHTKALYKEQGQRTRPSQALPRLPRPASSSVETVQLPSLPGRFIRAAEALGLGQLQTAWAAL